MRTTISFLLSAAICCAQVYQYPGNSGGAAAQPWAKQPSAFGAALKKDIAATTSSGVVRVVIFGDSLSQCTATNCSAGFPSFSNLWVNQLRTNLNSKYTAHGTGMIPFQRHAEGVAPNADYITGQSGDIGTCTANTPQQAALGSANAGELCFTLRAGSSVTLKSLTYDSLAIYYQTFYSASGGGFNVSIDGASQGTFGTQNTGCCIAQTSTIPAPGGLSAHTATITCNSSPADNNCYLMAFEGLIGTKGVSVDNLAVSSARVEWFSKLGPGTPGVFNVIAQPWDSHAHYIFMMGTNDYNTDTSPHYGYYLNGLLSQLVTDRGVSPDNVLVIVPPYENPTNGLNIANNDQLWYKAIAAASANAYGVGFLDLSVTNKAFGTFQAQQDAGFMMGDGIHLNDAGDLALFAALKKAVGL